MILKDLVFQGVYGCHQPVRLSLSDSAISHERLPAGVTVSQIQLLLAALFYPGWLTTEARQEVELPGLKLAVTFDFKDRRYRLLRREEMDSLRLQIKEGEGFQDLSDGPMVEDLLQQKLQLQDFQIFGLLNCWRVMTPMPAQPAGLDFARLDARAKEIIRSYRIAHANEQLEDQLKSLEAQVEQARRTLGDGAKLEDKLEQARQRLDELSVKELNQDDMRLLKERDAKLNDWHIQIQRLTQEEEQSRTQAEALLPEKPWRQQIFLGGLLVTVLALGASVAMMETARVIAVADVIGLSMCTWVLLKYYHDLERAGVHLIRQDSIKRRLNQVREEQIAYQERIKHLLIHAGVEREEELMERVEKSNKLQEIVEKMEAQYQKISSRQEYREASKQAKQLEASYEEIKTRFEQAPKSTLSAFQLENDLQSLGIDPNDALKEEDAQTGHDPAPYNADPFTRLMEAAKRTGQLSAGELDPKVVRMWSKIGGHLLGSRFEELSLDRQGQLQIKSLKPDQISLWLKTRQSEVELVALALALSLLVNAPARQSVLRALVIEAPERAHPPELATKLNEVLQSAALKTQILKLDPS